MGAYHHAAQVHWEVFVCAVLRCETLMDSGLELKQQRLGFGLGEKIRCLPGSSGFSHVGEIAEVVPLAIHSLPLACPRVPSHSSTGGVGWCRRGRDSTWGILGRAETKCSLRFLLLQLLLRLHLPQRSPSTTVAHPRS